MNQQELEKLCDDWLSTWTGNTPDKLLNFYSKDFYYQDPANPQGIKSTDLLEAYFTRLLRFYPDWIWKRKELMSTDKGFCLKWVATLNDGTSFEGLDIVELDSLGRIIRNEVYFDPKALLEFTQRVRNS